ncbi:hypothetical protein BP6252_12984 [Coleophoma cylindrospora]|uniref:Uncharacterized protein n=1 Tax=Coleophoma cylindrospora TaxID=1849047 RepID=A0A3D8QDU2_9HELO|nr:hypothetical protein BP6252_12984 [Coleophoma cylindrospora]
MGIDFSSQQLPGSAQFGVTPAVSFAYAESNGHNFGVDATVGFPPTNGIPRYGEYTPYLVQTAGPTPTTATCSPMTIGVPSQSIDCPILGRSILPGQFTVEFSQYSSTTSVDADGNTVAFRATPTDDSLTYLGAVSFSMVQPTSTVTISTTTTTITSGISELLPSATVTIPQTLTVTVFQTTVISTQTSLSTLSGVKNTVTVTGTCPSKPASTLLSCNRDNCLRALLGKSAEAVSFCSRYTKTSGLATPTYASQCSGVASRVSSACACVATAPAPAPAVARGLVLVSYGPPDFTYSSGGASPVTVTTDATSLVTVTVGPVPSSTL